MQNGMRDRWAVLTLGFAVAAFGCDRREAERPIDPQRPVETAPRSEAPAQSTTPGWITTKIQAQYFANPEIKPWNIDVTTSSEGVVTLRGEVEAAEDRREAVRVARETEGVSRVEDMLRVRGETAATTGAGAPPTPARDSAIDPSDAADLWITTKVQSKFFTDDDVRGRAIDVSTEDGVVTLRGGVDSYAQRRQAVALARNTENVREVRDELRVDALRTTDRAAQPVDDAWISTKIQSKYFLDPDVKGRQIDVSTENGVVTLTGAVDSDAQKQAAEQIARETDGVKDVRNQLDVRGTNPQ